MKKEVYISLLVSTQENASMFTKTPHYFGLDFNFKVPENKSMIKFCFG